MHSPEFRAQVELMLRALPAVSSEDCFAMHGGTAINLFQRDMPRLSVDVDLTYLPIEERQVTLLNIRDALDRISLRIKAEIPGVRVQHKTDVGKLYLQSTNAGIKIEVNLITRGTLHAPIKTTLCDRARKEYDTFCKLQIVPFGQLYGGKICAALDRQHPRDLFDIMYLLDGEGITDGIKEGFLLCLLSSDRPLHEILAPTFLDQRLAMINQFDGMSYEPFTYEHYESTRERLLHEVQQMLSDIEKEFLIGVHKVKPDWSLYNFEHFPSVRWKLMNLQKLKTNNPTKHQSQHEALQTALGI